MKIDRAAWPWVAIVVLLGIGAAILAPWFALPLAALLAFVVQFFRDPEREPPAEVGVLLGPADGRVIVASPTRVSIFMNVFNVHVCRTPVAGRVLSVEHSSGRFMAAFKDAASEHNERTTIVVASDRGNVRFTLVAGLVARRIVCRVGTGAILAAGDRVGIIRFGSRVDLNLPPECGPSVQVGDRVVAGRTVVARFIR